MKNFRNVFVTALVVIAAAIGFGVWKGIIPPKSGTEGAIGAATRYTSPQIADTDVNLTDPSIQSFLQSDLFHAIVTNPDFKNVITKDAFKKAVQVEGMLDLVAQDYGHGGAKDFNSLIASEDFKNVNKSADFQKAIKDKNVQNLIADADFQELIASEDFKTLAQQVKDAKSQNASNQIIKDAKVTKTKEWMTLSASEDFKNVVANHEFMAAVASTDMNKIIKDNEKLFASEDFINVLASEDFQNLVASEEFQRLVTSREYQNLTASEDFQNIAKNRDFRTVVKGDLAAAVAASEDMNKSKVGQ